MEKFVVAYAKIITNKDEGIVLQGVYFGGLGDSSDEADCIARECVNTIRGGTILPKVVRIEEDGQLLEAMYDVWEKFEQTAKYMREADEIIKRTQNRKK